MASSDDDWERTGGETFDNRGALDYGKRLRRKYKKQVNKSTNYLIEMIPLVAIIMSIFVYINSLVGVTLISGFSVLYIAVIVLYYRAKPARIDWTPEAIVFTSDGLKMDSATRCESVPYTAIRSLAYRSEMHERIGMMSACIMGYKDGVRTKMVVLTETNGRELTARLERLGLHPNSPASR